MLTVQYNAYVTVSLTLYLTTLFMLHKPTTHCTHVRSSRY